MDKRFLVFTDDYYYPYGGIEDLNSVYDTLEEALSFVESHPSSLDWWHIYDRVEGKIVKEFKC